MRRLEKSLLTAVSLFVFIFMLPFELTRLAAKRLFGAGAAGDSGWVSELYAEVFYSVEEALKIVLPDAAEIKEEIKTLSLEQNKAVHQKAKLELDPEFGKEMRFYVSSSGAAVLEAVKGKWGPIKFMLSFDNQGKIRDIVVLELIERRGRPVKERRFLQQYIGKSQNDPIKLNKDIKGIAGATISSRQMSDGIRRLVYTYEELFRK